MHKNEKRISSALVRHSTVSMDVYGCLWMSMDVYGCLCMSMDVYGILWYDVGRWIPPGYKSM